MLHEENKRAGVQIGTGRSLGLYFSMAGGGVSDRCERWASGVKCGNGLGL